MSPGRKMTEDIQRVAMSPIVAGWARLVTSVLLMVIAALLALQVKVQDDTNKAVAHATEVAEYNKTINAQQDKNAAVLDHRVSSLERVTNTLVNTMNTVNIQIMHLNDEVSNKRNR